MCNYQFDNGVRYGAHVRGRLCCSDLAVLSMLTYYWSNLVENGEGTPVLCNETTVDEYVCFFLSLIHGRLRNALTV